MHRAAERWLKALEPYAEKHEQGCFAARETQLDLLKSLLEKNADSEFGREHGFEEIGSYSDFKKQVPLMLYEDYRVWVDRLARGEQGVLTAEPVIGFEQTSGTTTGRKLIPYTEEFREQMAVAVGGWMHHWKKQYPRAFAGRSYWALSPPGMDPMVLPSGVSVGMDSDGGYFPSEVSAPLEEFLIVPELAGDYMENTARALLAAKDLSSISVWSPTFLLELDRLMRILDPELTTWSEYWAGLEIVSCWTDAQAARWIPPLKVMLGDVMLEPKGLMSTEGVCSIPANGGSQLTVSSHFYEFIGVDGIVLCDELKEGEVYEIVMTTGAGIYRYRTGDRVKVTAISDAGVPSFVFIGRGGSSDLVGEKLSEKFVSECFEIAEMSGVLLADVDHYILLSADSYQTEIFSNALLSNPYYQQAVHLKQLKPLRYEPLSEKKMFRWLESCASSTGARVGDVKLPSLVAMDSPFYHIIMESL